MSKKEILAYTAGLIDADGYIGLIPAYKVMTSLIPKVKLASTEPQLVEFLRNTYGGHLDKMRSHHHPNRKDSAMWTLSNRKNVGPFLKELLPYLRLKNRQANIVIDYIADCDFKSVRAADVEKRQEALAKRQYYYEAIRRLNYRGNRAAATTE